MAVSIKNLPEADTNLAMNDEEAYEAAGKAYHSR